MKRKAATRARQVVAEITLAGSSSKLKTEVVRQHGKCFNRANTKQFPTQCWICDKGRVIKEDEDTCRFEGCRTISYNPNADVPRHVSFDFSYEPLVEPHFPTVFNQTLSIEVINLKMEASAAILLPLLREEQVHIEHPNIIFRPRELDPRVTCDMCSTALFVKSWMCSSCGREFCSECKETVGLTLNTSYAVCSSDPGAYHLHGKNLLPITRFQTSELAHAVEEMKLVIQNGKLRLVLRHARDNELDQAEKAMEIRLLSERDILSKSTHTDEPYHPLEPPIFNCKDISPQIFLEQLWPKGYPIVLRGSEIQGNWGPDYWILRYGHVEVSLENCETGETKTSTVAEFLRTYGAEDSGAEIWKLKDWPPSQNFEKMFPELYMALIKSVPVPQLMCLNGSLNMAVHYPTNGIAPDAGPKMYLGQSSIRGSLNMSSTRLHMDVTDAFNELLFAANCHNGSPGYALWDFFRPEDAFLLRKFVREECGFEGPGDPIHSQSINFTLDLRERAFKKYGIRPITIRQYAGDIVFIPAYCAHQVANYTDCIKVACDMVSIDNLRRTERLVGELRKQRLATAYGDDVLAFYVTLWYAWQALSHELQTRPWINTPSPMDIDPLPAAFVTLLPMNTDPSLTTLTTPSPMNTGHSLATLTTSAAVSSPSLQKARRDRAYRKSKREKSKNERTGADFIFHCPHPHCSKMLTRSGYFDHIRSKHTGIDIDSVTEEQLRSPRIVADADFEEAVQPYLRNIV